MRSTAHISKYNVSRTVSFVLEYVDFCADKKCIMCFRLFLLKSTFIKAILDEHERWEKMPNRRKPITPNMTTNLLLLVVTIFSVLNAYIFFLPSNHYRDQGETLESSRIVKSIWCFRHLIFEFFCFLSSCYVPVRYRYLIRFGKHVVEYLKKKRRRFGDGLNLCLTGTFVVSTVR